VTNPQRPSPSPSGGGGGLGAYRPPDIAPWDKYFVGARVYGLIYPSA
jgi:hypothetical protein